MSGLMHHARRRLFIATAVASSFAIGALGVTAASASASPVAHATAHISGLATAKKQLAPYTGSPKLPGHRETEKEAAGRHTIDYLECGAPIAPASQLLAPARPHLAGTPTIWCGIFPAQARRQRRRPGYHPVGGDRRRHDSFGFRRLFQALERCPSPSSASAVNGPKYGLSVTSAGQSTGRLRSAHGRLGAHVQGNPRQCRLLRCPRTLLFPRMWAGFQAS